MLLDSQENVAFALEKNAGERKNLAKLPCFRLCGPLVDIVIDPEKHSKHHKNDSHAVSFDKADFFLTRLIWVLLEGSDFKLSGG